MKSTRPIRIEISQTVVGWRENIGLPELGIDSMPAKIDTGARTSALHAVDQELVEIDGVQWVEFMIPIHNKRTTKRHRAPFLEERNIKNSSGVHERRLIVRTQLQMAGESQPTEVSLTNREKMEFDIILGRTAMHGRNFLIVPSESFVLGQPWTAVKSQHVSSFLLDESHRGEEE